MPRFELEPDQSLSTVAILLFIQAALTVLGAVAGLFHLALPSAVTVVAIALPVLAGIGLLRGARWGWLLAILVVGLLTVLALVTVQLIGLLFDALMLFLLLQPAVREKFRTR